MQADGLIVENASPDETPRCVVRGILDDESVGLHPQTR